MNSPRKQIVQLWSSGQKFLAVLIAAVWIIIVMFIVCGATAIGTLATPLLLHAMFAILAVIIGQWLLKKQF
jgi:hypothetical protein